MSKKKKNQYFIIHKPYGMLSQFSPEHGKKCLGDLDYKFLKNIYPVGRLDQDSEGLLFLTNDRTINSQLLSPQKKHQKIYLVQVEGIPTDNAIEELKNGVEIKVKGIIHSTLPAQIENIEQPSWISERTPPVRTDISTSWLKITIVEGKNRQVRKMTAAIGHPTLRLIRVGIENISLQGIEQGKVMELSRNTAFGKLRIKVEN